MAEILILFYGIQIHPTNFILESKKSNEYVTLNEAIGLVWMHIKEY